MNLRSANRVVVIPMHNEAATIRPIVAAACAYLPVIVVDDASDDGSGRLAARAGATVVTLPVRQGKGVALRRGFTEALRYGATTVVTLDGDGQHDPQDIPRFLAASRRWPQSIIIGGRLAAAAAMPRYRLHAIQAGSFGINWLGNCKVGDTQSGFRAYPADLLKRLHLKHGGFLLESEILIKAGQSGYDIREIPIRAVYHVKQRSHYRPLWDGAIAAIYLLYRGLRFWPVHLCRLLAPRQPGDRQTPRPTWRQTRVVALATALLPVLFFLLLVQLLWRRLGLDMLTLFIRRFYDQRLLEQPMIIRRT